MTIRSYRLVARQANEILVRFIYAVFNLAILIVSYLGGNNLISISDSKETSSYLSWLLLAGTFILLTDSVVSFVRLFSKDMTYTRYLRFHQIVNTFDKVCYLSNRYRHFFFFLIIIANMGFISIGYAAVRPDIEVNITKFPMFYICLASLISGVAASLVDAIYDNEIHSTVGKYNLEPERTLSIQSNEIKENYNEETREVDSRADN